MPNYWDKQSEGFENRPWSTGFSWMLKIGAAILVLVIFFGAIGFITGWFNAGKDVVSPTNVKAQYRAVIDDYESLQAAAGNACDVGNQKRQEGDPTFAEDPATAYNARYRSIAVDYNRRQKNFFEAEKVGPKGYPREAPSLKQMKKQVC